MRRAAVLLATALAALPACGDDGPASPPFAITSPGTGDPNARPLLPLHVGYEGAIPDAPEDAVVDGTIADPDHGGTIYRAVAGDGFVQWYLVTDDGVFAAGNAISGRLDKPVLFAPATVRDGMTWTAPGFTFAATQTSPGHWHVTGTPTATDLLPAGYDFIEGVGLAGGLVHHLIITGDVPDAPLPQHALAADELDLPMDTGGISLVHLSMVARPDGHALLTVGAPIGMLGSQPSSLCLTTDGHTVAANTTARGAPISSRTDGQCLQAGFSDVDEGGTSLTQFLSTGMATSAFVRADGTVFYFGRMPSGDVAYQDQGSIQLDLGYVPVFFLPGANAASDPPTLVENCTNCGVVDHLSTMPFDHALENAYQRGSIGVPWDTLVIANLLPIRDDEGGTSFVLLATDGNLWTSTLAGPPHRAGRLPGVLSSQARVGGNEILRVVADGSVDRLHVSGGVLGLEHLGDIALPAGEQAEAAFVWHGDADGDHLLLFSTLYDDSFLGAHSHVRRSRDPLATGAATTTLPPALQLGEQALGGGDVLVCAPDPQTPLAVDGWSVGGTATIAFAQPGTGCVLVLVPSVPPQDDTLRLIEGDVPGLGHAAFALGGGSGGLLTYRDLAAEVFAGLQARVAATPGDTFVSAKARLSAGAGEVDLAHAPQIAPKPNGAKIADRAGHGMWIETDAGDLALIGPTTDLPIANSTGLVPTSAAAGGGVVAAREDGSHVLVTPTGTQIALPVVDVGDRIVVEVLADGTQCGNLQTGATLFCLPVTGAERTVAGSLGYNAIAFGAGKICTQANTIFDPVAMTITDLGPPADYIPPVSYITAIAYDPTGRVIAVMNTGQILVADDTGLHAATFDGPVQYLALGEHVLVGSADSAGPTNFVRAPRP